MKFEKKFLLLTTFASFLFVASTHAFACDIYFKSSVQLGDTRIAVAIVPRPNKPCTEQKLADFYNALPSDRDKKMAKDVVEAYLKSGERSSWGGFYQSDAKLGHPDIPVKDDKGNYTIVRLDRQPLPQQGQAGKPAPPPPIPGPSYGDIYDTPFDDGKIGSVKLIPMPTNVHQDDLLSSEGIGKMAGLGFALAEVAQSGALKDLGKSLELMWKTAVYGHKPPDWVAAADRAQLLQGTLSAFHDFERRAVAELQKVEAQTRQVALLNDMHIAMLSGEIENYGRDIKDARKSIEDHGAGFDRAAAQLTKISSEALHDLRLPDQELADIQSGKMNAKALNALESTLNDEIEGFSKSHSLNKLNALTRLAKKDSNPLRRAQYKNLLAQQIDSRGLVKRWLNSAPNPERIYFTSTDTTPHSDAIRSHFNEALGLVATSKLSDEGTQQTLSAMSSILSADKLLASGDITRGIRLLNRGRIALDYASDNERSARYERYHVSDEAHAMFGVDGDGKTLEGFELLNIANRLALQPGLEKSDDLGIHARINLRQAEKFAHAGDLGNFYNAIDNAWAVFDFTAGAGKGTIYWGVDTATGVYHMITSPLETAESLYYAVANYQETWRLLSNHISNVIDKYPTMTPFEKGELAGKIGAEIATNFLGVGIIKNAAEAAKVGKAASIFASNSMKNVAEGVRGLGRIADEAPSLLKYNNALPPIDEVFPSRSIYFGREYAQVQGRIDASFNALTDTELLPSLGMTFSGGRYLEITLDQTLTLYRTWTPGVNTELGKFWSVSKPNSSFGVQIDSAILPEWGTLRDAPWLRARPNYYSEIHLPPGTKIYLGEAGSQGGTWVGGTMQVIVKDTLKEDWIVKSKIALEH